MPFTVEAPKNDIPDGDYIATLERVEEDTGNFGQYRKWHFLVQVAADKIESFTQMSSANTGPNSKSGKWLAALTGEELQVGKTYEDPTGSRVVIKIGRNKKGYPEIQEMTQYVEPVQTEAGIPR